MLLKLDNVDPTKEKIKKFLESLGIKCNEKDIEYLFKKLAGKKFEELVESGRNELFKITEESHQKVSNLEKNLILNKKSSKDSKSQTNNDDESSVKNGLF